MSSELHINEMCDNFYDGDKVKSIMMKREREKQKQHRMENRRGVGRVKREGERLDE